MSESNLVEWGAICTMDADGFRTLHPRAIVVSFNTVTALNRAVLAEHCEFQGEQPLPSWPDDINELMAECHAASRRNGWWSNLETGEPILRDKGTCLCLVHSELSEGRNADLLGEMDDKLPHRLGAEVELADAVIRVADYMGGFGYPFDVEAVVAIKPGWMSWAGLHSLTSGLMEIERKRSVDDAVMRAYLGNWISEIVGAIAAYAERRGFDLWGAVREKMAYNAKRADHKPENRRQAGGKAW